MNKRQKNRKTNLYNKLYICIHILTGFYCRALGLSRFFYSTILNNFFLLNVDPGISHIPKLTSLRLRACSFFYVCIAVVVFLTVVKLHQNHIKCHCMLISTIFWIPNQTICQTITKNILYLIYNMYSNRMLPRKPPRMPPRMPSYISKRRFWNDWVMPFAEQFCVHVWPTVWPTSTYCPCV